MDVQRYDEAISHYSTALSLNFPSPQVILIKRSKARVAAGSWKEVLDDANQVRQFYLMEVNVVDSSSQVITLDPLSPWGYEMKHSALHKAGDFDNAVDALETMLSKIVQSPDPDIRRELCPRCHDKDDLLVHIIRQSMVTSTSAHRAHEQRFAKLFNGLFVIRHVFSSTRPPAVCTIEPNRHLHSNPCQSSKNLCHR